MTRWVYDFADGSKDMRELLGGKGAGVAEMTRVLGADRVPAGFTITTEACVAYMRSGQQEPEGMADQVEAALERLQEHAGKRLGDDEDPLLVSVRSGARESMPGMLDTVRDPHAKVLHYGKSMRFGRIKCTSRRTGMTCRSTRSGHGFRVSIQHQSRF